MEFFYLPTIRFNQGGCVLPEPESKHCIRVLRKSEGDPLLLTNGEGDLIEAQISEAHPKRCAVSFVRQLPCPPLPYRLTIAVAPTKNNNRLEWFLEKVTEIGIEQIIPLVSFHSERRKLNLERMQKILVAAMKQSQKGYLPNLSPTLPFEQLLNTHYDLKLIAHCEKDRERTAISDLDLKGKNILILIGPEGDFSSQEITQALENGFTSIHLGTSRLRTETAGIVAASAVYLQNLV